MELKQFEGERIEELSMIEVAYAILQETGDVYDFTHLLEEVQAYLNLSEEELESRMVRLYTDINIDGRFISLGENRWGLRAWYPIDSIDEEIVSSIDDEDLPRRRRRKKQSKLNAFDDGDMINYNEDDPEDIDDIYDEDYDEEDDEDDDDDFLDIDPTDDPEDEPAADEELEVYASDLDELGEEELDEIDGAGFEDDDDEDYDDFDDEEEEELDPEA
ncbi:DNA-directed RNA polymerase subunit delta [Hutsoniella sourekii]|uniref:DNA-directed RNA polymerase subunit delta n=1 Tax=Hutsoniella sourekii TaxID=87650 RepID=UPI00048304F9|nr:DNA-directed RNA polymerase subunit delta [Hutsoniella sourekii]